jgi:hypothetical protein
MFRSLYGKLALALMLLFGVIGAAMLLAMERMLEGHRLLEIATQLIVGSLAFSLLAALVIFNFLTRRLRVLTAAVDAFHDSNFTRPVRIASANAKGDEIERLAAAFQTMSTRIAGDLKQIEESAVQRRELLANVSHDLRTPLASMQGYLETLLLKHGTLPPEEERNYLEVAAKHSERLGRLVGDLFQLTKLEANEIKPQPEGFLLGELAQDVVQKFQLGAEKRGLRLEAALAPDAPPVSADIGMIERVLENLVENAMRHTASGGLIRVEVGTASSDGRVPVRVSDTGHGIPAEELANVFERYYRVNRGEYGEGGNAGLGLAIARRVVALHGGNIRVESTLGKGTTFSFDLPAA